MTLDEVLKGSVNGTIYLSDVIKWLGIDDLKLAKEIRDKLQEVSDVMEKRNE